MSRHACTESRLQTVTTGLIFLASGIALLVAGVRVHSLLRQGEGAGEGDLDPAVGVGAQELHDAPLDRTAASRPRSGGSSRPLYSSPGTSDTSTCRCATSSPSFS